MKPGPAVRRRSLYLVHSIEGRDSFMTTFDDADVLACYRRSESIVPQQALALMNSRAAVEAAAAIAGQFDSELSAAEFSGRAFLQLLGREPTETELAKCLSFLKEHPGRSQFVHALLNHNDFLVIR